MGRVAGVNRAGTGRGVGVHTNEHGGLVLSYNPLDSALTHAVWAEVCLPRHSRLFHGARLQQVEQCEWGVKGVWPGCEQVWAEA